jgi:hypothetical protein
MEDFQWHHLAVVLEDGEARLYVDGNEVSVMEFLDQTLDVAENGFIVGEDQDCISNCFQELNEDWSGDIDNLRIYRRALFASEVQLLSQVDVRP